MTVKAGEVTATMLAKRLPTDGGWLVVPYWFAVYVLMATRGMRVEILRSPIA